MDNTNKIISEINIYLDLIIRIFIKEFERDIYKYDPFFYLHYMRSPANKENYIEKVTKPYISTFMIVSETGKFTVSNYTFKKLIELHKIYRTRKWVFDFDNGFISSYKIERREFDWTIAYIIEVDAKYLRTENNQHISKLTNTGIQHTIVKYVNVEKNYMFPMNILIKNLEKKDKYTIEYIPECSVHFSLY